MGVLIAAENASERLVTCARNYRCLVALVLIHPLKSHLPVNEDRVLQ
jgi:hypothetical protein